MPVFYALIGAAVVYLFQVRRMAMRRLRADDFPELSSSSFEEFVLLLKTAYERTLYLGVLFFPLAWTTRAGGEKVMQLFFLVLIALMLVANIIPRNRIMRLLEKNGLSMKTLKERGVHL